MNEEISGLSLWMKEVRVFLEAEDAALGDLDTLDAQLKESNALQVRKGMCEYCIPLQTLESWFNKFEEKKYY